MLVSSAFLGLLMGRRADHGGVLVNSVRSVNYWFVAFAIPKFDHLRHGFWCWVTRMFDGLRSRWMIPDSGARFARPHRPPMNRPETVGLKPGLVAELNDRHALDQFHDEVGPAALRGAPVQHRTCWSWSIMAQRLALGFGGRPPAGCPCPA